MYKIFFAFVFAVLCSCSFNPPADHSGEDFLQGLWTEDTVPYADKLVSYEKYYFKFICDSFYLNIKNYSKVNLDAGECYNSNEWQEYVKGTYTFSNDTLQLSGAFVSSTYRFKPQGDCYRFGNFKENFIVKKISADSIKLENAVTPLPHLIILKEKLSCNKK